MPKLTFQVAIRTDAKLARRPGAPSEPQVCGVLPSLCMHNNGFVTETLDWPAELLAVAVTLTGSPMCSPRVENDAEYPASRALCPLATLQVPPRQTRWRRPR